MECHKCKQKFVNKDEIHFLNDRLYCNYCYQHHMDFCFNCPTGDLHDNLFIDWSFEKDYDGVRQVDQLCAKCFVDRLNDDQKEQLRKELYK